MQMWFASQPTMLVHAVGTLALLPPVPAAVHVVKGMLVELGTHRSAPVLQERSASQQRVASHCCPRPPVPVVLDVGAGPGTPVQLSNEVLGADWACAL